MANTKSPQNKKAVPSALLLALVAQFLEKHGFNSSHRIFNTERKKRPKKEGWGIESDRKATAESPSLEAIFQIWQEHKPSSAPTKPSSDGNSDDDTSDSESDASSDANSSVSNESSASGQSEDDAVPAGQSGDGSQSSSSSGSSSGTNKGRKGHTQLSGSALRSLKRKADDQSSSSASTKSEDDSSDSESDSEDERPVKKPRLGKSASSSDDDMSSDSDSASEANKATGTVLDRVVSDGKSTKHKKVSTSDSSDESNSSSEESQDEADDAIRVREKGSSDSSETITGERVVAGALPDSSANLVAVESAIVGVVKKKHVGAQPTRLAAMSSQGNTDDYISNTYISYDYADKAFRDLSVTRGKGFTKEKNKKKRGSYRGGAIDISGGKAFKFDD